MTHDQIVSGVTRVLTEKLRVTRPLSPSTDLLHDLQLDSLQQLTLVVELENHFRICFDPGDEQGISTVESVARLVARRLTAAA